jgi:hypothetical protein
MTGGVEDQSKYDETKRRMELIKRAIVGDPTRTLNGGPEISGFVADMGRLPNSIAELVNGAAMQPFSSATSSVGDVNIQLRGGWRGPYIDLIPDAGGARVLRDGYANTFAVLSVSDWRVKSLGADGEDGTDDDYPVSAVVGDDANVLVSVSDFEVSISGVGTIVNFSKAPASNPTEELVLRIYYMEDGVMKSDIEGALPAASGVAAISGVASHPVTYGSNEALPLGRYAAVLLCKTSHHVYDGDCSSNELHRSPFYFSVVPRTQPPTIQWNIQ